MRTLVIDDLRYFRDSVTDDEAVYARTPEEGVHRLSTSEWDIVCLDHDMGYGRHKDGSFEEYDIWPCMEYIEQHPERFKDTTFWIVTSSPVGGDRIESCLRAANLSFFRLDWREKGQLFAGA